MVCTNTTGKNAKSVVLKTQGSASLKDNIVTLFGISTFNCLEPLDLCVSDGCKVEGFVSKPGQGCGRNMRDRQFFFVNSRPVDMPKVTKLVNELYRGANSQQHPIVILNFTIPTGACDVNVTPDKRKVFFSDEGSILHALREGLGKVYLSSNARYSVNEIEEPAEVGISELCSFQKKSCTLLKPLLEDKLDTEEGKDEKSIPKIDSPVKTVEDIAEDIYDVRGLTCNSKMRDFTLRVHGIKKADDSKQLRAHADSILTGQNYLRSPKAVEKDTAANIDSYSCSKSSVQTLLNRFITVNKRKHESTGTVLSEMPVLRNAPHHCQSKTTGSDMSASVSISRGSANLVEQFSEVDEREPCKYLRTDKLFSKIANPLSSGANTGGGESKEVSGSIWYIFFHHQKILKG